MMHLLSAVEGIIFAAGSDGVSTKDIAQVLDCSVPDAEGLCLQLQAVLDERNAGIALQEVADTWQMTTRPEHAVYLKRMAESPMQTNLSTAALEVLAIVAYKQPITRGEIDDIRGVQSDRSLATLVHRQLVNEVGRVDAPGRPMLFGTTDTFLRHFGLKTLKELPPLPDAPVSHDLSLFSNRSEIPRD